LQAPTHKLILQLAKELFIANTPEKIAIMKILNISVANYRNLSSVDIHFDATCNFIVGENNLGKSNLLNLINTVFTRRAFWIDDFTDKSRPIHIEICLQLADVEIGHFEDLFDLEDYSKINIVCKQTSPDDNLEYYHKETETYIAPSLIKCLNFIFYDSLRNPIAEINFDKGRGVGRFLTNIVKGYLCDKELNTESLIDGAEIEGLITDLNSKLYKIKAFQDYNVSASIENEIEHLIPKLISLKDGKGDTLSKSGYGVQFLLLVTLSILDKLQTITEQRGERGVFEDEESAEKSISLVLGLDEPEIHLHPYMQRSLVKYLNRVINNENEDFALLVKELFGIDRFIGQVIIATHSPNIILNDYKQIVRIFKDEDEIKIISGSNILLGEQLNKHLFLHFPFIKEAFFSRCAIFVEGDSEYGSFPFFGEKLGIDFDDFGITVIQAGGDSVKQLVQIAGKFGIPCIGINDSDGDNTPTGINNLLKTNECDFEAELMFLIDNGKESLLEDIVCEYDTLKTERELDAKAINKRAFKKYGFLPSVIDKKLKLSEIEKTDIVHLKAYYSTWFSINKSQTLARLIGLKVGIEEIPEVYKNLIEQAKDKC